MTTFANGESAASVRAKINDAINKVDGNAAITSVNIDSGSIDGTTIGAASAAAGTFTTVVAGTITADAYDLAAIAESKAVTAVDVFVYDTSKDSDGGAWRKRTQHTSWYNETLNTATRGARREFPAVAVIVAEAAKVTIYDGDDPALPMWMVFEPYEGTNAVQVIFRAGGSASHQSITAINGILAAGMMQTANYAGGLRYVRFIADDAYYHDEAAAAADGKFNGSIARRNEALGFSKVINWPLIVNRRCNDVAMTVLPDAPIDPATGLPVPTIAVATAGGVSVIKDDGTVVDSASATVTSVSIDQEKLSYVRVDECRVIALANIVSDGFTYDRRYNNGPTISASFLPQPLSGSNKPLLSDLVSFAASTGLTRLHENASSQTQGMVAYTTSTYNTGWMNGNIKGAFLSSTDATSLVGSGNLGPDLTSYADQAAAVADGWSTVEAGWTFDAANDQWVHDGVANGNIRYDTLPLLDGVDYYLAFDVVNAGQVTAYVGTGSEVGSYALNLPSGSHGLWLKAGTQGDFIQFRRTSGAPSVKNISLYRGDSDRSVNNKGLIVNGTVTRSAVATGAELVAYSGFSASNYLEQPYNSALDFGTGDFCVMGWIKQAANTAVETILERDSATTAQRFTLAVNASGFLTFTCDDDTTARTATSNRVVDNDVWTHFVALYDGAGDVKIYLNGVLDDTETGSALLTLNNASAVLRVGLAVDDAEPLANADLALLRISATVPSDSQIKKIYNDERFLFQDNAQATLYGASNAVTALAHDSVTDLLHVGTSAGRSVFSGLRRVSNTTTAVGTAISASGGLVVEE